MWITILFFVAVFFVFQAIARGTLAINSRKRYLEQAIEHAGFPAHDTLIDENGRSAIATNAIGNRCLVAEFHENGHTDKWSFDAKNILGVAILENHVTLHEYHRDKREVHGADRKIQPIKDHAYKAVADLMKGFGFAEEVLQKSATIDRLQLAIAIERSHDAPFSDPLIFELVRTEKSHLTVNRGTKAHRDALDKARHWMRLIVRSIELATAEERTKERTAPMHDAAAVQTPIETKNDAPQMNVADEPKPEATSSSFAQIAAVARNNAVQQSNANSEKLRTIEHVENNETAVHNPAQERDATNTNSDGTHSKSTNLERSKNPAAHTHLEDAWAKQRAKAFGDIK